MIKLVNVSKIYGSDLAKVNALNNINLQIDNGKLTAIIGKSGSGKSTLMNLLGAIDSPTSGEIFFDDIEVTKLNDKDLSKFRNQKTGFIFQSFYLEPSFSVLENVCMPLTIQGIPKNEREIKGVNLLKKFDLEDKIYKKVGQLSGGQKQRVCIARALINNPEIVLADEPTGNLDSENGKEVLNAIKSIAENGKTVILVTHNIEDAKSIANRIIELKDGKVVKDEIIR